VTSEEALRNADDAHTRLLMDAQAKHALGRTTYEALRQVAERHRTLEVPQIAAALNRLRREAA
jgi:hypothetical protein